jgi:peptide/nickel transport system ATP-binding protein
VLEIKNLTISFLDNMGGEAVKGLTLSMAPGERLGLVGESGSGKTVTALAVAGLIERWRTSASGEILFLGKDLLRAGREELRKIQGLDIGFVFQEPMSSLNPLMKIGHQVEEAERLHGRLSRRERRARAIEAMRACELSDAEAIYNKYPHQLSGGQRQRAMIAAAIITSPKLLIADEPTTALDVSVQAQIISLLKRLSDSLGMGILFISHDLNVVRGLCTRIAVMSGGELIEQGLAEDIFTSPREAMTKRLISAIPRRNSNG